MYRRFLFAFCLVAGAFVAMPACSNQQEGERCDHRADNNGNDDCDDGLYCAQNMPNAPSIGADKSDVCCPLDLTKATTTACSLFGGTGDSGIPEDAAATPVDGGGDTSPTPDANGSDVAQPDSAADGAADTGADTQQPTVDSGADASADAASE